MQHRTSSALITLTALTALLAGCTQPASSPAASPRDTATSAKALPAGVTQATAVPTDVPNDPAIRQNVKITGCAAADGGWAAKGTADNPGKKPVTYTLTVFFTTDQATVLATANKKVTVEAGKSSDWTISPKFTPTAKTLCVLRGVGAS